MFNFQYKDEFEGFVEYPTDGLYNTLDKGINKLKFTFPEKRAHYTDPTDFFKFEMVSNASNKVFLEVADYQDASINSKSDCYFQVK